MKNNLKFLRNAIICLIMLVAGFTKTFASPATATFTVNATILSLCVITNAQNLNFGNYLSTADSLAQSNITLTCTPGSSYKVGLNAGATAGATVLTRQMKGVGTPTNLLSYSLYKDAARLNNWGNVNPDWQTGTAGLTPVVLTVYGKIPAGQNSAVDTYLDTITITLTFP
ncbi:MAG: spore coat U domain-containing protein [Rickettsia endosymbiont of Pentastiridius leporinus]